jgi:hypothetical protein
MAVSRRCCSTACQNRAARLRRCQKRRRYGSSGARVNRDRLTELRERAIDELVPRALGGAGGRTWRSVPGLWSRRPEARAQSTSYFVK